MAFSVPTGLPGPLTTHLATPREVFYQDRDKASFLAGPIAIDGTKSADALNTPYIWLLRAGTLMGQVTATGKYANSVIGVTTSAYTSGATTLAVSVATATEIVRRIGTSGTFKTVGPPSTAGSVAVTTTTFSQVDLATGNITVSSLGVNKVTDCLIMPTDGSETISTLNCDPYGTQIVDQVHTTRVDVLADKLWNGGGIINPSYILNWPSDASTKAWIVAQLRANGIPQAQLFDGTTRY